MVTAEMVLNRLPPFTNRWVTIKDEQYVPDIIREVSAAHRLFKDHYDRFSYLFYTTDPDQLASWLYWFCKEYIPYKEETKDEQTTAIPAAILERGKGDCKHYALFIAGVVGSLNRLYNCCFVAKFYFAAYKEGESEPYHVFVSVKDGYGEEIWIDPTPGSGGTPSLIVPKPV